MFFSCFFSEKSNFQWRLEKCFQCPEFGTCLSNTTCNNIKLFPSQESLPKNTDTSFGWIGLCVCLEVCLQTSQFRKCFKMFTAKQLENKTSYNLKHTEHSSFLGFIVTEHGEGAKLLNKLILFLFLFDKYDEIWWCGNVTK